MIIRDFVRKPRHVLAIVFLFPSAALLDFFIDVNEPDLFFSFLK